MVKDGVMVMSSGGCRTQDRSPKDEAAVEPSKVVSSKVDAREVEELDVTDTCIWSKARVQWNACSCHKRAKSG